MNTSNLILQFKGYSVDRISLNRSKEISEPDENAGFLLEVVPERNEGFEKVNVIEGIMLKPSKAFPYKLEVVIRGNFIISNCDDDKEKYKFLFTNASAILFPYLRSMVTLISSQLEYDNIVLPVMNFYKVFEGHNYDELINSSKQFVEF